MRELPLVTPTPRRKKTLMECVRTVAPLERLSAQTAVFPENCSLELAKGFEPLTL
jgi:hypothetical protein